jgi:hypothetical protein
MRRRRHGLLPLLRLEDPLLPFFSMCGGGAARTCPWRWLLHGAAATPVLYSERCSSLLRHVCCSKVRARAWLPWRSSAVLACGSLRGARGVQMAAMRRHDAR